MLWIARLPLTHRSSDRASFSVNGSESAMERVCTGNAM